MILHTHKERTDELDFSTLNSKILSGLANWSELAKGFQTLAGHQRH